MTPELARVGMQWLIKANPTINLLDMQAVNTFLDALQTEANPPADDAPASETRPQTALDMNSAGP